MIFASCFNSRSHPITAFVVLIKIDYFSGLSSDRLSEQVYEYLHALRLISWTFLNGIQFSSFLPVFVISLGPFVLILHLPVCATASKFVTSANFISMLCALPFRSLMPTINNPDVRGDKSFMPTPVALHKRVLHTLNVFIYHQLLFRTQLQSAHFFYHTSLFLKSTGQLKATFQIQ